MYDWQRGQEWKENRLIDGHATDNRVRRSDYFEPKTRRVPTPFYERTSVFNFHTSVFPIGTLEKRRSISARL
jgi:hypothetical protein